MQFPKLNCRAWCPAKENHRFLEECYPHDDGENLESAQSKYHSEQLNHWINITGFGYEPQKVPSEDKTFSYQKPPDNLSWRLNNSTNCLRRHLVSYIDHHMI